MDDATRKKLEESLRSTDDPCMTLSAIPGDEDGAPVGTGGGDTYEFDEDTMNTLEALNAAIRADHKRITVGAAMDSMRQAGVKPPASGTLGYLLKSPRHFGCKQMRFRGKRCYKLPAKPYDAAFVAERWGDKLSAHWYQRLQKALASENGNGHSNGTASGAEPKHASKKTPQA